MCGGGGGGIGVPYCSKYCVRYMCSIPSLYLDHVE